MEIETGDGRFTAHHLAAGDTMVYSTDTRHRWRHLGDSITKFVHVSVPG